MISIWHWHTEPALLGGILFVVWLYGMLVGPLRAWVDPTADLPRREIYWFCGAILSFYLAVGSPLDAIGENFLFSAHMLQHNVLMYVTPVLTFIAIPGWLIDGLLGKSRCALMLARLVFHPVFAGVAFTFVFSGWHFPFLYEWALHDRTVHVIEHLTMYGVSLMMLWAIRSRSILIPPLHCGTQILYIFLLMVAQIPLFGILTFSEDVLYPTYELAPRLLDWLDPLQDQVLGGLIMKVSNMALSLYLMGRAFYFWNRGQEASHAARNPLRRPALEPLR